MDCCIILFCRFKFKKYILWNPIIRNQHIVPIYTLFSSQSQTNEVKILFKGEKQLSKKDTVEKSQHFVILNIFTQKLIITIY